METLLFLSSGLFLGWSLGANDAANVFGTAVGTRMVKFQTAALVCSVFIVLGATISGAGAAHTLGRLGAVNALAGSFTVALASALTTFWMTRLRIPVSTSQSIVGAIIGWNLYSSAVTDTSSLTKIVTTWVACPLISGVMAVLLFMLVRWLLKMTKPHLLRLDALTRLGLLLVGAFGSYSLGANNIANVMGVFIPDSPFTDIDFLGLFTITGVQQLFFLGAVAIGVGVFTYSRRVMSTVGGGLARISPVPALVIVLAQSLTLFLFASESLEFFLASHGLPTFPLVPVSSSQAVIGAIVGLSLFKGGGIRYKVLGEISLGWVSTPLVAGVVAFLLLFVMDNVFDQKVHTVQEYRLDAAVQEEMERRGLVDPGLVDFMDLTYTNPSTLKDNLEKGTDLSSQQVELILELALTGRWEIRPGIIARDVDKHWLSGDQMAALRSLQGQSFDHAWQFQQALVAASPQWQARPKAATNKIWNKELSSKLSFLYRVFRTDEQDE
jgi:PiT family inorganic phosphate transporter